MTRLSANDAGHVITTLGEELSGRRHARATVELDGNAAVLYVLARAHRPDGPSLEIRIGDNYVGVIEARDDSVLTWHELNLPEGIGSGPTQVVLSSSGEAMNGWSLGVDYKVEGGDSLSIDGGATWSSDRIGYMQLAPGRYIVRARVQGGEDPSPAAHSWEQDSQPFEEFYSRIPVEAIRAKNPWAAVQILSTWVARSWTYRNTSQALQYAPWDPTTILGWGERGKGHGGNLPVAMCVHYGVVFVAACQALGITARCAPLTGSINGFDGHFVAEVWMERWGRWVMVDPTYDVTIEGPDGPADLRTIRNIGSDLKPYVRAGDGIELLLATKPGRQWFDDIFLQGVCFRNRSLWPRSDFLSRVDLTPPGHGTSSYSELDLVWEARSRDRGFGMFRSFADDAWFDAPPAKQSV